MSDPRIVSLLPSATEIVAALGFADHLVGRSHECDYPKKIEHLPVCTAARLDASRPSAEIDRQVKERLRDALSLYEVDHGRLRELAPTHVVTQTQCEVCAVALDQVEASVARITGLDTRLISLDAMGLDGIWTDIRNAAAALDAADRGDDLVATLQRRMAAVSDVTASVTAKPTVASIEWIEPLMAGGNWLPELVTMAGGVNLFGAAGTHSPWLTWEALAAADPDVIIVLPCGFDIARTRDEAPALARSDAWSRLRAVRAGRVYLTDGNQYFNRPGPRIADSLEILAEILHPDLLAFGHYGTGWQPL